LRPTVSDKHFIDLFIRSFSLVRAHRQPSRLRKIT